MSKILECHSYEADSTEERLIIICGQCEDEHDIEECIEFNNVYLCPECIDRYTRTCDSCGERIWRDNDHGDANIALCQNCFENNYYTCNNCNCLVHRSEVYYLHDNTYCMDCYEDQRANYEEYINSYDYKPDPIFYGSGIHYGIELEIDGGGEVGHKASKIIEIANHHHDHIYIKHDGSLDNGFEIVTHPMSISYHQAKMPWCEILSKAVSLGYRSHQAITCGLHVHVEKEALGHDEEEQEQTISSVLYFVEKHWDQLLKFSRRTESQIKRWASRYGYKENPKELLDFAKNTNLGRYASINLQNEATIEFRIFRGTLKYETLIATLQMVDEICNVAIILSSEKLKSLSWQDFVKSIDKDQKAELVEYLKIRDLYVNEPMLNVEEDL